MTHYSFCIVEFIFIVIIINNKIYSNIEPMTLQRLIRQTSKDEDRV